MLKSLVLKFNGHEKTLDFIVSFIGQVCLFPELQKALEREPAQSGKHGDLRSQACT